MKKTLGIIIFVLTTCSLTRLVIRLGTKIRRIFIKETDMPAINTITNEMKELPYSLEQLNTRLDRVNRWIENCDQKVCILLAFVGACFAVFFSSSVFQKARAIIIIPFYSYLDNKDAYVFNVRNFFLFLFLLAISIFAIVMVYYFLKVLYPRTEIKKILKENPELESKSLLFFQTISEMKFAEFKHKASEDTIERYKHDLYSQIYINSKISDFKYKNLKSGLLAMSIMLICMVIEAFIAFFFL